MTVRWRIVGAGALLAVPLVILAAFAAWFWCAKVPRLAAHERGRVTRAYREVASALATNETASVVAREKGRGWPQTGRIGGVPWGYRMEHGRVRVWLGDAAAVRSALTDPEEALDVELLFGVFASISLLLVFLSSLLGFRTFVRLERDRRDFVAAAAHDLETPVAALGMVLENHAAGLGTEAETFDECARLALRLSRLVDNLRDFIHRGRRGAPVLTDFDLLLALREAYLPFAPDYRDLLGADVPIVAANSPGAGSPASSFSVHADETLTQQILWNLFANDLKYAAPYGPVRVVLSRTASRVSVSFVDGGLGLTPSERKRIFDRYYRAQSSLSSGRGGFGIGLCSAREFARAMGGDLTVRANSPRGCVFTLTLPAAS